MDIQNYNCGKILYIYQQNLMDNDLGHVCYVLISGVANKFYIGYTVNFNRRIRQHNGEISGGAKKTTKYRPWRPLCIISGFYDNSSALRFEYRLQHSKKKDIVSALTDLINAGDGSIAKGNKLPWPILYITWYNVLQLQNFIIDHPRVINNYVKDLIQ